MNILFLTQSETLSVFFDVAMAIRDKTGLSKVGFYVADSAFYDKFKRQEPRISSENFKILKEWEIIEKSIHITPDIQRLRDYEKRIGDPVLWNALVADRRILLGKRACIEQDYRSRFSYGRMLAILQTGITEMENLFDSVQPDIVVGFICVTLGDYLAYLIAKSRKIPLLNLRPTRIKNYFFAGESVLEPSEKLRDAYQTMLERGVPESQKQEISSSLAEIRQFHAMYEGVKPPPGSSLKIDDYFPGKRTGFMKKLRNLVKQFYTYNFGKYRYDNHHRGVFYPIWFNRFKRPARIKKESFFLRRHYIDKKTLSSTDYAFYPLHKEPEVTLLVYGRPFPNQIEVVRNFARSLPVGMKLVVKEHPGAVGYRPLSYYKKLSEIPNVHLASPKMTSRELIQNARLITIIGGSVGLEAVMTKKPVIMLGRAPFNFLPRTMLRYVKDLDNLAEEIHSLLESHVHDESTLIAYLAAVKNNSVPIDFYSVLLGKKGVFRPEKEGERKIDSERQKQTAQLAEFIVNRIKNTTKL